jgi:hypothetical protein
MALKPSAVERLRRRDATRKWRLANPEEVKATAKRYNERHPRKRQWSNFRCIAKKRGIELDITFEFFCGLRETNECHYCGGPLPIFGGGIDRKNPALGYIAGNCVPCCETHNKMKWNLSYEAFIQECKIVAERFRG